MKMKLAAALVAALMVFAVLPAGAHTVDGDPDPHPTHAPVGTPWAAPAKVSVEEYFGEPNDAGVRESRNADLYIRGRLNGHDGEDAADAWPSSGSQVCPDFVTYELDANEVAVKPVRYYYTAHTVVADGTSAKLPIDTSPEAGEERILWCVSTTPPSVSPTAAPARSGVAQERETARHGNPGAYKVFYCSSGVEKRAGAPAATGCQVLIGGQWRVGASVQFVKSSSYRGFIYTLS